MRTFNCLPHPALRPCIDRFWGWECAPGEQVALPVVLPGTGAELFFHHGTPFRGKESAESGAAGRPPLARSHLLCLRHRPLPLAPLHGVGFVAIRFRAGRLGHLAAVPAAECLDEPLSIEALWGAAGRGLAERVQAAPDFPRRVEIIEEFLLGRLEHCHGDALVAAAIDRLYRNPGMAVGELADALGIGRRQLERRFLAREGLTPAEFRVRVRFQKAVRSLILDPARPLLDAALEQGYHDQSHFCRDFKALAGQSPGRYLAAARELTHFYNTPRR